MELEETRMQWKQRGHLLTMLNPTMLGHDTVSPAGEDPIERDDFVERFCNGDLEGRESVHVRRASAIPFEKEWESLEAAR